MSHVLNHCQGRWSGGTKISHLALQPLGVSSISHCSSPCLHVHAVVSSHLHGHGHAVVSSCLHGLQPQSPMPSSRGRRKTFLCQVLPKQPLDLHSLTTCPGWVRYANCQQTMRALYQELTIASKKWLSILSGKGRLVDVPDTVFGVLWLFFFLFSYSRHTIF